MSDQLNAAIGVLQEQLQQQLQEVADTKRTINALLRRMGRDPLYGDVVVEEAGTVRPDQYYGRPLATAAQEYLERRKQACAADEILKGLEQGGFDFGATGWKEKDRLRSFSISLAKNTAKFHRLPNGTFGLLAWYPEVVNRKSEKAEKTNDDAVAATSVTVA